MRLVKRGLVGEFPNVLGSPWSMCPLSLLMPITCYFVSTISASPIVFNVVVGKSVLTRSDAPDARCARRPMLKTGKGSKLTLIDEVQGIQIARNEQHLKNLEALASQVFATGITTVYSSFWWWHSHLRDVGDVLFRSSKKGPKAPSPLVRFEQRFINMTNIESEVLKQHFLVGSIWFPKKAHWLVGISNSHRMDIKVDGRCHKIFKHPGSIWFFHAKVIHRVSSRHLPTFCWPCV